ncbi:MAG: cysteine--1-D-myo-inosityl 2-amino-2-deoxy-alpha-D-glucopyranoside ligase [Nocardioidaceae bacterium]
MDAWPPPSVSAHASDRLGDAPELSLFDARTGRVEKTDPGDLARLYVCGITPYDATHLGHAATYLAFDLVVRAWRQAGHRVRYVQNVTDIDDPLLERAKSTGIAWDELATREIGLFREDMTALSMLPPDAYVGAVESIPLIVRLVQELQARDAVYDVDGDLYYSVTNDPMFGAVSGLDRAEMLTLFAERGGDPDRPGKHDPLDALVWQRQRAGEPGWSTELGTGRPGWHSECSAIALDYLGADFDIQGGGSDLIFPHHEMSAGQMQVAKPGEVFAKAYVHAGMVGFQGHKMSKSRGNLVKVSTLRADGIDPRAIRLALLSQHYRSDWDWRDDPLVASRRRLARWRAAVSAGGPDATEPANAVRAAMAEDLDAPAALRTVDDWVAAPGPAVDGSGELMAAVVESSLGVTLD